MIKNGLLGLLLLLVGGAAYGQNITYTAEEKPVTEIIADLEAKYDLHFSYAPKYLRGKTASLSVTDEPLTAVLVNLLGQVQLTYRELEGGYITIVPHESIPVQLRIVDEESGLGLPFATVRIGGTHQGFVADEDGRFNFLLEEPAGLTLEFSFLGYRPQYILADTLQNYSQATLALKSNVTALSEVLIREYITNGILTDERATKVTILPQEMEILPGLSERDILLSAQIIAGVGSTDETASGINVRGSGRDNTFIYWNNIPIYSASHYFGNISAFIPASIGAVDVYKNYIPVAYGNATAGMLQIMTRDSVPEKPTAEVHFNLTHLDAFAHVPLFKKQAHLLVGARRSYNELWATPTFNAYSSKLFEGSITQEQQEFTNDEFRYNSRLSFDDLNLVFTWQPTGQDRIQVSAIRSSGIMAYDSFLEEDGEGEPGEEEEEAPDEEGFVIEEGDEGIYNFQNHEIVQLGANLQWNHRWGAKWQTDLSASRVNYFMTYGLENQYLEEEIDRNVTEQELRENSVVNTELRLTNTYTPAKGHVLQFGYQYNLYGVSLSQLFSNNLEPMDPEDEPEEPIDSEGILHAGFLEYIGDWNTAWHLAAGVRSQYSATTNSMAIDPQLRLTYTPNSRWLFKATVGQYRQSLSALQELSFNFTHTFEQQWIFADDEEEVNEVVNRQVMIGAMYDNSIWVIDLDLYAKRLDGLAAVNFGFSLPNEDLLDRGSDQVMGLDLTVKRRWKNLRLWASYAFQDSRAEIPELGLDEFPSALNIRHQIQLSQSYRTGPFEFSMGYTYKSGLPYTEALSFELQPDEEDETELVYKFTFGEPNAERLAAYHRVDASAWYRFPGNSEARVQGEAGISLLNILNRDNPFRRNYGYDIDETEEGDDIFESFVSDKFLLPFTPNVSVRLRF
ncbi:MAG: TonB-dependent receptor [Bacteroidota bacterium]